MKINNGKSFLKYQKEVQKKINQSNDQIISLDKQLYRIINDYPSFPDGVIMVNSIRVNFNRDAIKCFEKMLDLDVSVDTPKKEESYPVIVYLVREKGYMVIRNDDHYDYKIEQTEDGKYELIPRVSPGRISLEWNGRYAYGRRFLTDDSLSEFPAMLFISRRNGRTISRMTIFICRQLADFICEENNFKSEESLDGVHLLAGLNSEKKEVYVSTKPLVFPQYERHNIELTTSDDSKGFNQIIMTKSGSFKLDASKIDWPEGIKISALRRFELLDCMDAPDTFGLLLQPLDDDERKSIRDQLNNPKKKGSKKERDKRQIVKKDGKWSMSSAELTKRILDISEGKTADGKKITEGYYNAEFILVDGDKVLVKFKV